MNLDISDILDDWPYQPGQVTARRIVGRDGRAKIQLRLDLGLLQMEAVGRPDGQRPHGCESLLDYHELRLEEYRRRRGSDEGFELDEADCELLRAEAVMYYHRYLAEFVLNDYADVERDTTRNLRLMDFCRKYAREDSDKYVLEQYRPYLLMMRTRAQARRALADNRPKAALAAVRNGIRDIEAFYRHYEAPDTARQSGELAVLRALEKEVEAKIPVDPVRRIRRELAAAVEAEDYERAARLRDRLRQMTKD
ncbi:MAG: UvrB/UvrC motif-containing protein [Planctomycetes bacterium]|nr:UvrB/UvrC motif-containing protein [Planctomycetota bacterium]